MRLIEKAWYQNHPLKWLLLPLNLLFFLLSAVRRMLYRLNILKQVELDVPVVIVGNIGVGGNGKTPMVIYLVEQLQQRGITVGVISRGYGGEKRQSPLLLTADTTAEQAGDEPVLISRRCQVPVVVSSDRVAGVKMLMQQGCNMVISDDGLQHYRLKRDVELVIVDGKRRFGNGWLLPAGPLREGLWRLQTVDKVIVNGGLADVNEQIMNLQGNNVIRLEDGKKMNLQQFKQEFPAHTVNAMAGIGNPERFFMSLHELGFTLAQKVGFVDHHQFTSADFQQFSQNALDNETTMETPLLMTEKDAVKCHAMAPKNSWYLPVDAHFEDNHGEQLIDLIITRCRNYGL
ncbi:tetraacyldisaccharide 4'-kinase [Thalassotalea sp. ND16A]|uniref:tetraacyldisaccharide 4'-kinase n=1 Tax=Thalassotalea sp. ND16A TaxID=1535422 RepID=UPI00051D82CB|nr:tetraacyldisaccharide 4'-kinase [Thalassotalea sp. ND16A]KGJ87454.1 Tetraacyldisaccharide 4'-kinase [Thalassotalea sp. ND16A]